MDYDRRMKREVERGMIERCRHGEEAAWDELFSIHYGPTSRFVFQLSGDFTIDDSEEICQEAFLSVVKNLGDFSGRSALQTWIFRIAANKARDYRSKQMAAKRGGGQTPADPTVSETPRLKSGAVPDRRGPEALLDPPPVERAVAGLWTLGFR